MLFVGAGDFKVIGEKLLGHFIEIAGLKPGDRVLDVGCGIGRLAVPLTGYLKDGGSYEGIDIVPDGIRWCKKNITPQYPNFRFQLADVYNETYNPKGKYKASEYRFPYEEESFDFIFLTSVFTHMLRPEIENYLSEISRVLKKGGSCLITMFLLNEESLKFIELKQSPIDFRCNFAGDRVNEIENPCDAVAYTETYTRELYEKNELEISEPIYYGSWCGRKETLCYQDYIFSVKKSN
jgi:ubiquinone/menaquinone biosynthesis C-methylase UbiE